MSIIRSGKVWLPKDIDEEESKYTKPEPPDSEREKYVLIVNHDWGDNKAKSVEKYQVESDIGNRFWVGAYWLGADKPSAP